MINLKQLLGNKRFSYMTLLNPTVDLNRPIEAVDTAETPDVYFYVSKNTFLITTAMIYKDNQEGLSDLIRKLADLPIATLAIKLGRFIDRLDDEVIKTATELNFPLILIPQNITTGELYRQVTSFLVDSTSEKLVFAFDVQKKFYNLALENSSLSNLIQSLSTMIKRTVVLVDPFGNITTSSRGLDEEFYKKPIRGIIENILDLRDEKNIKRSKLINNFNQNMNIDIYPIKISKYYPYYLIIFDPDDSLFFSINLAIEQAILVLAFLLYKDLRIAFSNLSIKYNVINDVIHVDSLNNLLEDRVNSLMKKYNIGDSDYYQATIISVVRNKIPIETHSFRIEWFTLIYQWLERKIQSNFGDKAILFPDTKNFQLILIVLEEDFPLYEIFTSYRETIYKTLDLELIFGVGSKVSNFFNFRNSYLQAKDALYKGDTKDGVNFIKCFTPLKMLDLLQSISPEKIDSFINHNLGPLANPKDKYLLDLQKTLETYLNYNCDITKTAEELFVHRNTVIYRIEKCEELLGIKIDPSVLNYDLVLSLGLRKV